MCWLLVADHFVTRGAGWRRGSRKGWPIPTFVRRVLEGFFMVQLVLTFLFFIYSLVQTKIVFFRLSMICNVEIRWVKCKLKANAEKPKISEKNGYKWFFFTNGDWSWSTFTPYPSVSKFAVSQQIMWPHLCGYLSWNFQEIFLKVSSCASDKKC